MSAINLRLPDSLHSAARDLAKRDNISLNQLITLALAEKISALMTEDYLNERAAQASRSKFESALAQIPNRDAPEQDKL